MLRIEGVLGPGRNLHGRSQRPPVSGPTSRLPAALACLASDPFSATSVLFTERSALEQMVFRGWNFDRHVQWCVRDGGSRPCKDLHPHKAEVCSPPPRQLPYSGSRSRCWHLQAQVGLMSERGGCF